MEGLPGGEIKDRNDPEPDLRGKSGLTHQVRHHESVRGTKVVKKILTRKREKKTQRAIPMEEGSIN